MKIFIVTPNHYFNFLTVVLHDQNMGANQWSVMDTLYFWLVTFTTVGFGDKHLPLHVEIEHFYELLLYRMVGLSFLAGIIDSIQEYLTFRKTIFTRSSSDKFRKLTAPLLQESVRSNITFKTLSMKSNHSIRSILSWDFHDHRKRKESFPITNSVGKLL